MLSVGSMELAQGDDLICSDHAIDECIGGLGRRYRLDDAHPVSGLDCHPSSCDYSSTSASLAKNRRNRTRRGTAPPFVVDPVFLPVFRNSAPGGERADGEGKMKNRQECLCHYRISGWTCRTRRRRRRCWWGNRRCGRKRQPLPRRGRGPCGCLPIRRKADLGSQHR